MAFTKGSNTASYMPTLPGFRGLEVCLSWGIARGTDGTCLLDAQREHQVICYWSPLTNLPEVLLWQCSDLLWDSPTLGLKSFVAPGYLGMTQVLHKLRIGHCCARLPTHTSPSLDWANARSLMLITHEVLLNASPYWTDSRFEIGLWCIDPVSFQVTKFPMYWA